MSSFVRHQSFIYGKTPRPCANAYHVLLLDDTTLALQFSGEQVTGRQVLECVCKTLGVATNLYYGLQRSDRGREYQWLELDKPIKTLKTKDCVKFAIKFWPRNATDLSTVECELVCLQIRKSREILDFASINTRASLDALFVQFWLGDNATEEQRQRELFSHISSAFSTSKAYQRLVQASFSRFSELSSEDAVLEFLELAQNIPFYGVSLHQGAVDSNNTSILLGFSEIGLTIHELNCGRVHKVQFLFAWHEIAALRSKKHKLKLTFCNGDATDTRVFTFRFPKRGKEGYRGAKRACNDAREHQRFYLRDGNNNT